MVANDTANPTTAASPTAITSPLKQPFYKKRWFIISQIILIPLSIALLFILLFPVVRAIVALVIKRANLDVQAAVITQPINGSCVLAFDLIILRTNIYVSTSFNLHLEGNVRKIKII